MQGKGDYVEMEVPPLEASKRSSISLVQQMEDIGEQQQTDISIGRHLSQLLTGVDHGKNVQFQRTKEDRKQSFAYVKSYIRKEKWSFLLGSFYLVMGLLIDLAVPAYIGLVTNDISNGIDNNLVSLSIFILLIIGVSPFNSQ